MEFHCGRLVFSVTRYLTLLKSNMIPDSDRNATGHHWGCFDVSATG
jgi:hypothetical protein